MMNIADWIQLGIMLVAVIGVLISLHIANKQNSLSQKAIQASFHIMEQQCRQQFFAEYTKRYQEIILKMPSDLSCINLSEIEIPIRLYFNLCSEEYHLRNKGYINDEVWNLWKEGMIETMHQKVFRQAWAKFKSLYSSDFWCFFEHEVLKANE